LEITYLGHSAFRLRGKDVTVVTDPFSDKLGFSMGKVTADIVTVSHQSPNHSFIEGVGGDPRVVEGPGEYEVADMLIAGVATATEPGKGPVNTAYVLRFEDLTVCHLGDLNNQLTDKQVEELGSIDVLLIPVGGAKTIGPAEASQLVARLDPSLVIPMHYRLRGSTVADLAPIEHFCREMGSKDIVPEPKLTVTKGALAGETRLVVLEARGPVPQRVGG
jgi:L-ascorbate metabolism protein UlaG (beta-lactamase superfamily)